MWEKKGGEGLWEEWVNTKTGESSIKQHTPKVVWKSCNQSDHKFQLTGNREATCEKCGFIRLLIIGQEIFQDGKITKLSKK